MNGVKRTGERSATGWVTVGLLTLLSAAVNWQWLRTNVVTYGWDRMDHLITSLAYNNILQRLTPQSLFEALAFADYYPPLVHFGMVLAYKVFGVDEDIAAMTNVVYLALLLGATWAIAKRAGGGGVAVLATVILATFPMIFMMSRYLYLDFALTSMVAVSIALLLATERFTRRTPSLLFGLALGLTFLVKWTAAAFLAAPLLFIVWRSGAVTEAFRRPTLLVPEWKRLLIALGTGTLAISAWLFAAQSAVLQTRMGMWLIPALAGLLGAAVYAVMAGRKSEEPHPPTPPLQIGEGGVRNLTRRSLHRDGERGGGAQSVVRNRHESSPVANALGGAAVGTFVMALWYLVNSEFIAGFFYTAYGREGGRFLAFDKYLYEVATEQIGPMYTVVFLLAAVGWLWRNFTSPTPLSIVETVENSGAPRTRAGGTWLTSLPDTQWVLALWAVVPYIIFSAGVSLAHSRFLMPFLPPLAIWLAMGLWSVRNKVWRIAAVVIVTGLAVGQFALLSFEGLAGWREDFVLETAVGRVDALAHGFFIQAPASGDTNPSYAIAPSILDRAEQARVLQGREFINLGVLVNSHQLHEKHFLYQIYIRYPNVLLRELARNWSEQPAYAQLFEMDYVLVSDTHSYRTSAESQAVIERLLYDERDLFNQAFRPVERWEFLSGEQVTLYERRFAPKTPGTAVEDYQAVVQAIGGELGVGDAVLLVSPDQAYATGLTFPDGTGATFLPLDTTERLEQAVDGYDRVFLLSHNANQSDPGGAIEGWLRANRIAGGDQWFNAVRMTPFVRAGLPDAPAGGAQGEWENGARLVGSAQERTPTATAVRLFWEASGGAAAKVSVQLLAQDGSLVAQQDADLVNGVQSFALLIPRGAEEQAYRTVVALYDPVTLERYGVVGGGDVVEVP